MIDRSFSLIPFPGPNVPALRISGRVSLQDHQIALHYSLTGKVDDVLLPSLSINPGRRDELWKATCFEFFLAIKDQPGYWEFNMSPSGDWNVYRMDSYRRVGFREETAISRLEFEFKTETDGLSLVVTADLIDIVQTQDNLEMAITAIIQTKDGTETYWALGHPAPQADFHIRESFILPLGERTHPAERSALAG